MKRLGLFNGAVIGAFLGYMFLPIAATYLFSIATRWDHTLLPEGVTLDWYQAAVEDRWFFIVFQHSLIISAATVAVSLTLVVPTAYYAHMRLPAARALMDFLTTLPFGIPAVVLALGLIRLYSEPPLAFARSPIMLVLANVIFTLPFVYRPIVNSLLANDIRGLTEASHSLGASWGPTVLRVILPIILPGVISGGLLVFATIFGEFTLATLLVGARYKTFPMQLVYYTRRDGRIASAYSVISFTVAWLTSLIVLWVVTWGAKRLGGRKEAPVGGAR